MIDKLFTTVDKEKFLFIEISGQISKQQFIWKTLDKYKFLGKDGKIHQKSRMRTSVRMSKYSFLT